MTGKKSTKQPGPHFLVPGYVPGWLVCSCGCGYVAVCRHCVPTAPQEVPSGRCDAEQQRLHLGRYATQQKQRPASGV